MDPTNASSKQLLAAYKSLSTKRLYSFFTKGAVTYVGTKLGPIVVDVCPSTAISGSICHKVTASSQVTYSSSYVAGTNPLFDFFQFTQDAIDVGDLDCDLEALFPSSPLNITDGGGCKK